MSEFIAIAVVAMVVVILLLFVISKSFHSIGETEVGLVIKKFGKKLPDNDLIATNGEAGYQPDLLMPGWRIKVWPVYKIEKHPRVQIPPNAIGVVIAQVGAKMATGAKSAEYNDALGDFSDLKAFLANGGQRGPQRPVLAPGTNVIHPIAFVVVTKDQSFGKPLSKDTSVMIADLQRMKLEVEQITPDGDNDYVGIVTTLEGPPSSSGSIASRLGGFGDIEELEQAEGGAKPAEVIQKLLGTKNSLHNNYQDFQAFLDQGGCIGLQHDPLLYGAYLLNPLLVKVEKKPMLVINQGEVAVVKSYVGLPTIDNSGDEYKFGSIVSPGHMGLWSEPLRTGKYALNPRIYESEVVPTSILTLNWANATSDAHDLDEHLSSIDAKSKEAFDFKIDLQVQIHVPDTKAPKVIGMVGTMQNLVNEVLQSAVGNYFRNTLQSLAATRFIETRSEVQDEAEKYVTGYLARYDVEVRGVYIQDVVLPKELVDVLTKREIANQEKATYVAQEVAQQARVALERQTGIAGMQIELSNAEVSVDVKQALAKAAVAQAEGEASVVKTLAAAEAEQITVVGEARGSALEAEGVGRAKGYTAQREAIGSDQTALVAVLHEIAEGNVNITPNIVVGADGNSSVGGILTAVLAKQLDSKGKDQAPLPDPMPEVTPENNE